MSKLINKNIVRAMTIGISAVMASNSMNLSAFAASTENVPASNVPENTSEKAETQSELTKTLESIGKVMEDKTTDTGVKPAVKEAVKEVDTASDMATDTTLPVAIEDDQDLKTEETNGDHVNEIKPGAVDVNEAVSDIEEALGYIQEESENIDTYTGMAKQQEQNANSALSDAQKLEKEADDQVKPIAEKLSEADKKLDIENDNVKNAEDKEAADKAMGNANAIVDAAEKNVDAAEKNLKETEKNFNEKKTDYDNSKKKYEAALGQLETAKENVAKLQGTASDDADLAEKELQDLIDEVAKLKANTEKAEEDYNKEGYALIAALEAKMYKESKERNYGTFWGNSNALMEAIMEFYIFPSIKKNDPTATLVGYGKKNVKLITNNDYPEYAEKDVYKSDDENLNGKPANRLLNHYEMKYTVKVPVYDEEGNKTGEETVEKVARYNYKQVLDGYSMGSNDSTIGLIIFESMEHTVLDHHDLTEEELAKLNAETDNIIVDEEAGYAIVKIGEDQYAKYAISAANGVTDTEVEESKVTDEQLENLLNDEKAEAVTEVEIKDEIPTYTYNSTTGELIKTVTADVTTTKYTGAKLDAVAASGKSYENLSDAQAKYVSDLQDVVDGLKPAEGETTVKSIRIGNIEIKYGEKVSDKLAEAKAAFRADVQKQVDALSGDEVVTIGGIDFKAGDVVADVVEESFGEAEAYATIGFVEDTFDDTVTTGYKVNVNYGSEKFTETREIPELGQIAYGTAWAIFMTELTAKYDFNAVTKVWQRDYEIIGDIDEDKTSGYFASGTLTANVVKLSKKTVTKDWLILKGIWKDDEESDNVALAKEGKHYVGYTALGDGSNKYTVYYYLDNASKEVTVSGATTDVITDDSVKTALAEAGINDNNLVVNYDKNSATAIPGTKTYYGYNVLKYLLLETTVETDKKISTTTWDKDDVTANSVKEYRNDNWYSGNIALAEYDYTSYTTDGYTGEAPKINVKDATQNDEFRKNVKEASDLAKKYTDLLTQLEKTDTKLGEAKKEVEKLETELAKIKTENTDFEGINQWTASLEAAKKSLEQAKKERDELVKKLDEVSKNYDAKVKEFRDREAAEEVGRRAAEDTTTETVTIVNMAAPLVNAPAQGVNANAGAGNVNAGANDDQDAGNAGEENETENIGDEESALAEGIGDGTETENIGDEESALIQGIDDVTTSRKWNWWWLLAAGAVTGGATFGIINGNRKKKNQNLNGTDKKN
jgi:hypothetical protein